MKLGFPPEELPPLATSVTRLGRKYFGDVAFDHIASEYLAGDRLRKMPSSAEQGGLIFAPLLRVGLAGETRSERRKALEANPYSVSGFAGCCLPNLDCGHLLCPTDK